MVPALSLSLSANRHTIDSTPTAHRPPLLHSHHYHRYYYLTLSKLKLCFHSSHYRVEQTKRARARCCLALCTIRDHKRTSHRQPARCWWCWWWWRCRGPRWEWTTPANPCSISFAICAILYITCTTPASSSNIGMRNSSRSHMPTVTHTAKPRNSFCVEKLWTFTWPKPAAHDGHRPKRKKTHTSTATTKFIPALAVWWLCKRWPTRRRLPSL